MKHGQSVTFPQLESAFHDVQRELERAGLWHPRSRLTRTQVIWCWATPPNLWTASGFFVEQASILERFLGLDAGNVYIPKWVFLQGPWQYRGSLRDVLRHEFGHALAHHHPGPIRRSRAFRGAFGAHYDDRWRRRPKNRENFVSRYATTSPAEDFAEVFAHWLRRFRKGGNSRRRPATPRHATPVLRAKFEFVDHVCRRLAR